MFGGVPGCDTLGRGYFSKTHRVCADKWHVSFPHAHDFLAIPSILLLQIEQISVGSNILPLSSIANSALLPMVESEERALRVG
jgi:hypothetical protein